MKNLYIKDLKRGESFSKQEFALKKFSTATKKDGSPYLKLELSDKTGNILANMWTPSPNIDASLEGSIFSVSALVDEFNGKLQLNISEMSVVSEFDANDFMAASRFDIAEMWKELQEYKNKIKNKFLKETIDNIFDAKTTELFQNSAAGLTVHHAYKGGLLEHTLEMLKMSECLDTSYPKVNKDLLISGIILHDIGKIVEYETGLTIKITTRGKLLGHITIGSEMIRSAGAKYMPADLLDELIHLVLSHHGELEFGSPVKPSTAEAIAISRFDDASAKINASYNMIQALGEGIQFTQYHRQLGVELYNSPYLNELVNEDIPF